MSSGRDFMPSQRTEHWPNDSLFYPNCCYSCSDKHQTLLEVLFFFFVATVNFRVARIIYDVLVYVRFTYGSVSKLFSLFGKRIDVRIYTSPVTILRLLFDLCRFEEKLSIICPGTKSEGFSSAFIWCASGYRVSLCVRNIAGWVDAHACWKSVLQEGYKNNGSNLRHGERSTVYAIVHDRIYTGLRVITSNRSSVSKSWSLTCFRQYRIKLLTNKGTETNDENT